MGGRAYRETLNFGLPLHWNEGGMTDGHLHNTLAKKLDSLLNLVKSWKPPVATVGDLPASGNEDGDARVVVQDGEIYVWITALGGWQSSTVGGDPHWKAPVASPLALPLVGNNSGDVRVVLSEFAAYVWTGSGWQYLVALDKTHEAYCFSEPAVVTDAFITLAGGMPSNFAGYPIPVSSVILRISAQMVLVSACVVQIYDLNGPTLLDSLTVNGTYATKTGSILFPAGGQLSCRISGTANGPVVVVVLE